MVPPHPERAQIAKTKFVWEVCCLSLKPGLAGERMLRYVDKVASFQCWHPVKLQC